jgi:coenzyme PQQ biosynthesis protein PqqD
VKRELPSFPKLVKRARLRTDEKTGELVLLYPEKGLSLNASAAAIARRCDGSRAVEQITHELAEEFDERDLTTLEREVRVFLSALQARGLLERP